jgi:predicted Zn-dependent protease
VTTPAVLSQEECESLTRRILELVSGSQAQVALSSVARSTTEFARGDTHVASEVVRLSAQLSVEVGGRHAEAWTNQLDDAGLRTLVAEVEALARENPSLSEQGLLPPQTYPEAPQIYFDATAAAMAPEPQAALVHRALDAAEAAGLISAGDVALEASARVVRNTGGLFAYERTNYGEVSVTARSQEHRASGWAWSGFEDWGRVDAAGVISRAIDLARRSANPVAVEPGRYTVILEPAAVAALVNKCLTWDADAADLLRTVYGKQPIGTNKIGLQMMDRRLGMVSDPWDPERPASTIGSANIPASEWRPLTRVVWFDRGVLKNLAYNPDYARDRGREPLFDPGGVRLTTEGQPTSLEDMIASTKRGIWVNRLSHIAVMNSRTVLLTGTTRDGTFLIENGKITKPIKNLRFTDSPFFVFNQLEAWGQSVRASRSIVAPRLMLRDFNFSSLTDAI